MSKVSYDEIRKELSHDKVVRYSQAYNIQSIKRNPPWDEQQQTLKRIEDNLAYIRARLESRG